MLKAFWLWRIVTSGFKQSILSIGPSGAGFTRLPCIVRYSKTRGTVRFAGASRGLNQVRPWVPPNTSVPSGSMQDARSEYWLPPVLPVLRYPQENGIPIRLLLDLQIEGNSFPALDSNPFLVISFCVHIKLLCRKYRQKQGIQGVK